MLTNIYLKHFRGFKDTAVGPLKRVNLIVGQNDTGKTGLLEALALLLTDPPQSAHSLPQLFRSVSGDPNENFWKWLRYNKDSKNAVQVRAQFDDLPEFGVLLATDTGRPQGASHQFGGRLESDTGTHQGASRQV